MDEQTEFYYTIDMYGLLGGAHLGGVGGVVRALRGKGNAKDMNGSSVLGYMTKFSQSRRGAPNASSNLPVQITQSTPQVIQDTSTESPEFIPWNSQAFFGTNNNTPIIIQQEAPIVEEKTPTPEEIERQERQQGLANFQTIMGLLNNTSNSTSTTLTPFESTVSMLTQRSPIHYFSDGGSIHIKPENRGKFTRLKERTGHSATWFKEHGTPAQKKMATFALNAKHWKHGLGGNLFEGGGNTKAGIPVVYPEQGYRYAYLNSHPNESVVMDDQVVIGHAPNARQRLAKYLQEAPARDIDKVMAGYLATGIAPVAIQAAAPGILAASDAIGSSVAGQAANKVLANPYFTKGLESAFAGHGLNHAINEGIDGWGDAAMTAMELAPLERLAKPLYEGVVQPGMKVFNSPLTGNWTKIGNREYRLSPNSLEVNGSSLESRAADSQGDVTDNLLKWLGRPKVYKPEKPISQENSLYFNFKPVQGEMARIWKDKGVNLDRISGDDIEEALKKRWDELVSSRQDRHTIVRSAGNDTYFLHDLIPDEKAPYGWRSIGTTQLNKDASGNMHMADITNNTGSVRMGKPAIEHGVQERALNAAIKVAKQESGEGVVTGEWWLSAPKQQHVVQKYHDRQVVGNTGQHTNSNMVEERINADIRKGLPVTGEEETLAKSMLDLRRAGDKEIKTLFNQPFWLLRTPIKDTPVKSTLFDPTIIDRFGKMHIDWSDPNIFRGVAYPTLIGTGLYGTQEK